MDIDRYLSRLGLAGAFAPTLETLAAIHAAHVAAIPFENLDPLLGRPVRLDAGSLHAKLVLGGRGGYCYEHNLLLGDALRALGFPVRPLAARVMWGVPDGVLRPRTHMLLSVQVGAQAYVADAGFGGLTLTAPLRLGDTAAQDTPFGRFRLQPVLEGQVLQAEVGGEWRSLYSFDLQAQDRVDFELTSWYLCHHPESPFRQTLRAARVADGGRYALLDARLTFYPRRGAPQILSLPTAAALRRTLEETFGITVAGLDGLEQRLGTFIEKSAAAD